MSVSYPLSPFSGLASVEAWDAWFRWRERGRLRDVSIEDTWRRVARTLASVEPHAGRTTWEARFLRALASWRVLPDQRLLAGAGCGHVSWRSGPLYAVLNATRFISWTRADGADWDIAAIVEHARLAVWALDNAALLAHIARPRLRVGIVGIADALALLGIRYASVVGCQRAARLAQACAQGCVQASVELAVERGMGEPAGGQAQGMADRERARHARSRGARHPTLTALTRQPRLALLANDVADAADPLRDADHVHRVVAAGGSGAWRSPGYALNVRHDEAVVPGIRVDVLPRIGWEAQLAMRAALQPWMDEPIVYPLLLARTPGLEDRIAMRRRAVLLGLAQPRWRVAENADRGRR